MADFEKSEAETRASKEAAVEKLHAERDQAQKQEVDDHARDECERRRVHAAELATMKCRAELRETAADGLITQVAAEEMLSFLFYVLMAS